jgi:uncharacterized protein YndB with AHSA1/START domain
MDGPSFVYVTYIRSTPEQLWLALTDGELTPRYWFGRRVQSDWRAGSRVAFFADDGRLTDSGQVFECERPRRLSYSWTVEFIEELRHEPPSRVTFELERMGDVVKLVLTHEQFGASSGVRKGGSDGWPIILSSLKSMLETGDPLAVTSAEAAKRAEQEAIARMHEHAA